MGKDCDVQCKVFFFKKQKQSIIVAAEWIGNMQIMQRLIIG